MASFELVAARLFGEIQTILIIFLRKSVLQNKIIFTDRIVITAVMSAQSIADVGCWACG